MVAGPILRLLKSGAAVLQLQWPNRQSGRGASGSGPLEVRGSEAGRRIGDGVCVYVHGGRLLRMSVSSVGKTLFALSKVSVEGSVLFVSFDPLF